MRHMLMRLVIGLVWLAAAIVSAVTLNFSMVIFFGVMGVAFLFSAYSIWKKDEGK